VKGFEKALDMWLAEMRSHSLSPALDLAYCHLQRIDLSHIDLDSVAGQIVPVYRTGATAQ
jgi:hypothetical protein